MTNRADTIAHNRAAIKRMREQAAAANVAGGTCPKCGEGANPAIVANFGQVPGRGLGAVTPR